MMKEYIKPQIHLIDIQTTNHLFELSNIPVGGSGNFDVKEEILGKDDEHGNIWDQEW